MAMVGDEGVKIESRRVVVWWRDEEQFCLLEGKVFGLCGEKEEALRHLYRPQCVKAKCCYSLFRWSHYVRLTVALHCDRI